MSDQVNKDRLLLTLQDRIRELEQENSQLASELEARKRSEALYRMLQESLHDAFVQVDMQGIIINCNDIYCQMLGYSLEELRALTYRDLTPDQWHAFEEEIVREQIIPCGFSEVYEKEYRRKDGTIFPVELRTILARDPADQPAAMWAIVRDISERKKAEERKSFLLQLSDALRSIADAAEIEATVTRAVMNHFGADRCYYCDIQGGNAIIRRDTAREDLPSVRGVYPLDSMPIFKAVVDAGRPLVVPDAGTSELMDEDLRQLCLQMKIIAYIDVPVIKDRKPVGILCITQSSTRSWTEAEVELAVETAERTWAAVERARTEEALRENQQQLQLLNESLEQKVREKTSELRHLASELIRAEQRERNRISHILHDDLQQRIYAIQMQLSFLRQELSGENETAHNEVSTIEKELEDVLNIARHLSIDLNPPILRGEGLTQAITWLAAKMQQQYGLRIEIHADEAFTLSDEELHVLLFNCVRELLFNVVKHAQASQAEVTLQWLEGKLQIEVSDNGIGLPLAPPGEQTEAQAGKMELQPSFGHSTIRHQLSLYGGSMVIHAGADTGTHVILTVPALGAV